MCIIRHNHYLFIDSIKWDTIILHTDEKGVSLEAKQQVDEKLKHQGLMVKREVDHVNKMQITITTDAGITHTYVGDYHELHNKDWGGIIREIIDDSNDVI
jgi:hypothetical protein